MTTDAPRRWMLTPRAAKAGGWALFALLAVSVVVTLFGLPEMRRAVAQGRWPPATLAIPAALLAVFAVGYAAYRIALVRAGRYPAGRALVRIALVAAVVGAAAGTVLVPPEAIPGDAAVDLARPLRAPDPEARAVAAELVRFRPRRQALAYAGRLVELLDDGSPEVRRQARLSLIALAGGKDVGGRGPDSAARWREHFRR
jgi:hypothetical protein